MPDHATPRHVTAGGSRSRFRCRSPTCCRCPPRPPGHRVLRQGIRRTAPDVHDVRCVPPPRVDPCVIVVAHWPSRNEFVPRTPAPGCPSERGIPWLHEAPSPSPGSMPPLSQEACARVRLRASRPRAPVRDDAHAGALAAYAREERTARYRERDVTRPLGIPADALFPQESTWTRSGVARRMTQPPASTSRTGTSRGSGGRRWGGRGRDRPRPRSSSAMIG